jgi:hypothetical protein
VLAVAVVAFAFGTAAASATAPVMIEEDFSFQQDNSSLCGFPIELAFEGRFTLFLFFDREGNLVRVQLIATDVATATNPANGQSVSGHEVLTGHVDLLEGTESDAGVPIHFNVPGGNALLDAGRVFVDSTGELRLSGNFEFSEGDLAAFCAACPEEADRALGRRLPRRRAPRLHARGHRLDQAAGRANALPTAGTAPSEFTHLSPKPVPKIRGVAGLPECVLFQRLSLLRLRPKRRVPPFHVGALTWSVNGPICRPFAGGGASPESCLGARRRCSAVLIQTTKLADLQALLGG